MADPQPRTITGAISGGIDSRASQLVPTSCKQAGDGITGIIDGVANLSNSDRRI